MEIKQNKIETKTCDIRQCDFAKDSHQLSRHPTLSHRGTHDATVSFFGLFQHCFDGKKEVGDSRNIDSPGEMAFADLSFSASSCTAPTASRG